MQNSQTKVNLFLAWNYYFTMKQPDFFSRDIHMGTCSRKGIFRLYHSWAALTMYVWRKAEKKCLWLFSAIILLLLLRNTEILLSFGFLSKSLCDPPLVLPLEKKEHTYSHTYILLSFSLELIQFLKSWKALGFFK